MNGAFPNSTKSISTVGKSGSKSLVQKWAKFGSKMSENTKNIGLRSLQILNIFVLRKEKR